MTNIKPQTEEKLASAARLLAEGLRQKDVAETLGMTRGGLNNLLAIHAPSLCFSASDDQAEAARKWLLGERGKRATPLVVLRKTKPQGCVYWRTDKGGVCGEPVFRAGYCECCFPKTVPLATPLGGVAI